MADFTETLGDREYAIQLCKQLGINSFRAVCEKSELGESYYEEIDGEERLRKIVFRYGKFSMDPATLPWKKVKFDELPPGSLDPLDKLKSVFLSECGIKRLDRDLFAKLPELEVLGLESNPISELPKGIFRNNRLIHLYLSYTNIGEFDLDIIDDKSRLSLISFCNRDRSMNFDWLTPEWFRQAPQTRITVNKWQVDHIPKSELPNNVRLLKV